MNEVSGRKTSNKAKLKANSEKERIKLWHDHFKELLGKPTSISTNDDINERSNQEITKLDIKTGLFTSYELTKAIKSIQSGKAVGLDEIPAEVWKLEDFQKFLLESCNSVYSHETIERWREGCILPFPKKGNLSLIKNYRGITLTSIAAKIFNLMILNRIRPEIDPILRKNQNVFRKNRSTSGQILTIRRILEGVKSKNLPLTLLFIDFSKEFDSIKRNKMEQIMQIYGIPTETIEAIMMLYINTRSMLDLPMVILPFSKLPLGYCKEILLLPVYIMSRLYS